MRFWFCILIFAAPVLLAQTARPAEPKALELERAKLDRARFERAHPALEGTEALYKEGPGGEIYALVRLKDFHVDDWGIKAKVEVITDLASTRLPSQGWRISAAWDVLSFDQNMWHLRYVNWTIYVNQELVRKVKAQDLGARPLPDRRTQINRIIDEWQSKQLERRSDPRAPKEQ